MMPNSVSEALQLSILIPQLGLLIPYGRSS
jgi:hypothetical protein